MNGIQITPRGDISQKFSQGFSAVVLNLIGGTEPLKLHSFIDGVIAGKIECTFLFKFKTYVYNFILY